MVNVTKTTQYSTFELIRDIIRTDSTLATAFPESHFHEYEVKTKGAGFSGFPYMVIKAPKSDTDPLTINKAESLKTFTPIVEIYVDYFARSNITNYINRTVRAIEENSDTLKASGYKVMEVDNIGTTPAVISQQDVFITRIQIDTEGLVVRT